MDTGSQPPHIVPHRILIAWTQDPSPEFVHLRDPSPEFVHHRHPKFSFNLMMPIGDWLRRVDREADALDMIELRRVGGPG